MVDGVGIESGHQGILAKILCAAGGTVNVGQPIAIYVDNQEVVRCFAFINGFDFFC
jgi:pyruvate/2-oxoglutarate dehydrogenase complex dihydrolipoamide acyltransferase (E2) component